MFRFVIRIICLSVMATACIGCGDSDGVKLAKAGGTVTMQDAPLSGANVTFIPESGPVAVGQTDDQGKFTLSTGGRSGAPVGNCRVSIQLSAPSDDLSSLSSEEQMRELTKQMGATQGKFGEKDQKSLVPEKYSKAETSGLAFTVSSDASENDFKIALQP